MDFTKYLLLLAVVLCFCSSVSSKKNKKRCHSACSDTYTPQHNAPSSDSVLHHVLDLEQEIKDIHYLNNSIHSALVFLHNVTNTHIIDKNLQKTDLESSKFKRLSQQLDILLKVKQLEKTKSRLNKRALRTANKRAAIYKTMSMALLTSNLLLNDMVEKEEKSKDQFVLNQHHIVDIMNVTGHVQDSRCWLNALHHTVQGQRSKSSECISRKQTKQLQNLLKFSHRHEKHETYLVIYNTVESVLSDVECLLSGIDFYLAGGKKRQSPKCLPKMKERKKARKGRKGKKKRKDRRKDKKE